MLVDKRLSCVLAPSHSKAKWVHDSNGQKNEAWQFNIWLSVKVGRKSENILGKIAKEFVTQPTVIRLIPGVFQVRSVKIYGFQGTFNREEMALRT